MSPVVKKCFANTLFMGGKIKCSDDDCMKANSSQGVIRVAVLGTRGIPNVQGGIETHCQHLFPRLAKMGFDVTLYARECFVKKDSPYEYDGVHVVPLKCNHRACFETISHMFHCYCKIRKSHPDIVHIHAIGPALFAPLIRLTGAKVVYTHHGQDYNRAKWGRFAKFVLKMGERLGTRFSHRIIVISNYIEEFLKHTYKTHRTILIRNGVEIRTDIPANECSTLKYFGIKPKKYILACGRFVKEKGFHDLLAAYSMLPENLRNEYKLVIAGRPDHKSSYSQEIVKLAEDMGVVLTGFICGDTLCAVQRNARLFVIPSYHEGLPIALLEALSYNLDVVASDIPANTEIPLPHECFAKVGDVNDLAQCIAAHLQNNVQENFANIIHEYYDWDKIAERTAGVYKELVSGSNPACEYPVQSVNSNLQDECLQTAN